MRTEVIHEFIVFAKHLNFSRAAAELHITQPSLSKHMAELEREVGIELIDRKTFGKNRPALTNAGKYFLDEMSYMEETFQDTLARCRAMGGLDARDIRIQELWQNHAMFIMYSLAGTYQVEHPENAIRYVRLSEKDPIEALLAEDFDAVVDVWCGSAEQRKAELRDRGVFAVHLITEPPVIWVQEGNRHLEGKVNLKLEDLLTIPVIITRGTSLDYVVESYAGYCKREGLSPRLRRRQLPDNSPTGVFMSDFHDAVLMTTPAMENDPRLSSRTDLMHHTIEDERVAISFLLAVRFSDRQAVSFATYVSNCRS